MKMIDGRKIADEVILNCQKEVEQLKKANIFPKLAILLIGDNPSSEIYVKNKIKKCNEIGIATELIRFSDSVNENELIQKIQDLNSDVNIHGIILQLPLPSSINEKKVMQAIDYQKDVDGFTYQNIGALASNNESIFAATPKGIITILDKENISVSGKDVVIVGRSNIVGRPLALALLNRDATVTICHSQTNNLKEKTKKADILIVAIGKPNFISSDYVKDGAVVIDVGINRVNGKLQGDVSPDVYEKVSLITPVPGGVGPMTVAMVISNLIALIGKDK